MQIVTDRHVGYPITPNHIDPQQPYFRPLSWDETCDAVTIVQFCQTRGGWCPFTKKEIADYCVKTGLPVPMLDDFVKNDCLFLGRDRRYRLAHEFIVQCFLIAPALQGDQKVLPDHIQDQPLNYTGCYMVKLAPLASLEKIPKHPEVEMREKGEILVRFGRIQQVTPGFRFFSKSCSFAYTRGDVLAIQDLAGKILWKNSDTR